jgi:hypothetical protein
MCRLHGRPIPVKMPLAYNWRTQVYSAWISKLNPCQELLLEDKQGTAIVDPATMFDLVQAAFGKPHRDEEVGAAELNGEVPDNLTCHLEHREEQKSYELRWR